MVGGIKAVAEGLAREFRRLLPGQRKTQRNSLALLAATMLEVRSANLMDLAAALPREAERTDMRYQWIARVLGNGLIDPDAVMAPFAREVLARAAGEGRPPLAFHPAAPDGTFGQLRPSSSSWTSPSCRSVTRCSCWRCGMVSARCRSPGASRPRRGRSALRCKGNCSKRPRPGWRRVRRCA